MRHSLDSENPGKVHRLVLKCGPTIRTRRVRQKTFEELFTVQRPATVAKFARKAFIVAITNVAISWRGEQKANNISAPAPANNSG